MWGEQWLADRGEGAAFFSEVFEEWAASGEDELGVGADGFFVGLEGSDVGEEVAGFLEGLGVTGDDGGIGLTADFAGALLAFSFDFGDFGFSFVDDGGLQFFSFVDVASGDGLAFGNPAVEGLFADAIDEADLGDPYIDDFDPATTAIVATFFGAESFLGFDADAVEYFGATELDVFGFGLFHRVDDLFGDGRNGEIARHSVFGEFEFPIGAANDFFEVVEGDDIADGATNDLRDAFAGGGHAAGSFDVGFGIVDPPDGPRDEFDFFIITGWEIGEKIFIGVSPELLVFVDALDGIDHGCFEVEAGFGID